MHLFLEAQVAAVALRVHSDAEALETARDKREQNRANVSACHVNASVIGLLTKNLLFHLTVTKQTLRETLERAALLGAYVIA